MPRNDDLKNRLDELFSSMPGSMPGTAAMTAEPEPIKPNGRAAAHIEDESNAITVLRAAFDFSSSGMLVTTTEGDILYTNYAFSSMIGFSVEEVAGKNILEFFHPDDYTVGMDALSSALSQTELDGFHEINFLGKDGQTIKSALNINRVSDSTNLPVNLVIVVERAARDSEQIQFQRDALSTLEIILRGEERIFHAESLVEILLALVECSPLGKYEQIALLLFDQPFPEFSPEFVMVEAQIDQTGQNADLTPGKVFELSEFPLSFLDVEGKPLVISNVNDDLRIDAPLKTKIQDFGVGIVSLPVISGTNWYGWILGLSSVPTDLDDQELRGVLVLADRAASKVESRRLQKDMADRLEELTSLQRLLSQTAWSGSRLTDSSGTVGYAFDQVQVTPISAEAILPIRFDSRSDHAMVPTSSECTPYSELTIHGERIGVLGVEVADGGEYIEEESEFLRAISEQVSQALERARLMEQTRKSAVELQAVADVSTATASILNPTELLQNVVDLSKERFNLYHAHIYLYDEGENRLNLTAGAGDIGAKMVQTGWSIPFEKETSIVARAARSRAGQIVGDVRLAPEFLQNPLLPDTRSELAVPIIVGDRLLGVFDVQSDTLDHFANEEVRTFTTLAAQIGVALQNALLYAEQLEANYELASMNQISGAVSHTLEIDQVLDEILQHVLEITEYDSGLISYVDPKENKLRLAVQSNLPEGMVDYLTNQGMDGTACDLVYRTGQTVHVPNLNYLSSEILELESKLADTSWPHEGVAPCFVGPRKSGFASYTGVPLVSKGVEFGTVCVFNRIPKQIKPGRLSMLEAIGNQVGVAVENSLLYAEQIRTVERLRELDNMKSAFLANMSHELRTPLNSILGFTQVIIEGLDGPLTEMMTADLELIEKNGKHLLHLINDVLDLARIEAGKLSLSPELTNIFDLLEDVMMFNTALAREKGLDMKLIADPSQDWVTLIDQVRMRQIFINLIGNSLKFTDAGGIFVEMDLLMDDSNLEKIQIRIRDTGIGIPREKLEEIFEAFSQIDTSTTRKAGGTGLGLPISRRLVELHGGRLWAESEGIGKGSTFHLELPVTRN